MNRCIFQYASLFFYIDGHFHNYGHNTYITLSSPSSKVMSHLKMA